MLLFFEPPNMAKKIPASKTPATTKSTEIQISGTRSEAEKENKVKKFGTKKRDHHLASVGATEAAVPT
jgi:hypothetical protein